PVIRTTVPAKHLQTEGNDLREWGYTGPHKDMPTISYKGGYHQEIRTDPEGRIKVVKRRKPKTASAELEMRTRKGRRKGIDHTFEPEEDRGPGYMVRYPGTAKTADYRLQHQAPDEESGKPYHHFFGGDPDEEVRKIGRASGRERRWQWTAAGAEDGIRDFHVTGVQTCALPISRAGARASTTPSSPRRTGARATWSGIPAPPRRPTTDSSTRPPTRRAASPTTTSSAATPTRRFGSTGPLRTG